MAAIRAPAAPPCPRIAVAFIAAVAEEELFAVGGVAGRGLREQMLTAEKTVAKRSMLHGYLGCVTTSIMAGSPFFTTSIARLMAGPRSLGLSMGPSLNMP